MTRAELKKQRAEKKRARQQAIAVKRQAKIVMQETGSLYAVKATQVFYGGAV